MAKQANVISHWDSLIENFQASSLEFYNSVEKALEGRCGTRDPLVSRRTQRGRPRECQAAIFAHAPRQVRIRYLRRTVWHGILRFLVVYGAAAPVCVHLHTRVSVWPRDRDEYCLWHWHGDWSCDAMAMPSASSLVDVSPSWVCLPSSGLSAMVCGKERYRGERQCSPCRSLAGSMNGSLHQRPFMPWTRR